MEKMTQKNKDLLLKKENSLLVIIDIQERLLPAMAEGNSVLDNAIRLIKFATLIEMPVILTEQQKLGKTVPELRRELETVQAISKWDFNCFGSEEFREKISRSKRDTLIMAGLEAHVCVAQTALHAIPDFAVHVVQDAVSSRSLQNWEIALRRMAQQGITITSTEMVIFELLERAGTDLFREALNLVK